jgi:WD40 repeat protein
MRLERLMQHAGQWQRSHCTYHTDVGDGDRDGTASLLVDHVCQKCVPHVGYIAACRERVRHDAVPHHREAFPRHLVRVLHFHQDEVWHVQFSHDGSRLATASKDTTVAIWDMACAHACYVEGPSSCTDIRSFAF